MINNKVFSVTFMPIPAANKFKFKVGKDLSENSSKKEVFEKILELINFVSLNKYKINIIFQENLPLFPRYEKEIKKYPTTALVYSCFFMKSRWKEAEKIISKDKICFGIYVSHFIKTRVLELEKQILLSPETTYFYCKNVFKRKKIPEEIHNAMITHALKDSNNTFVKKYFKIKKVKVN